MILVKVGMTRVEDNFEEGETGDFCDYGYIAQWNEKSYEHALNRIKREFGEPCIFEDQLTFNRLENLDGMPASEREIKSWKENENRLYSTSYNFYFYQVEEIKNAKLKYHFENLEEI